MKLRRILTGFIAAVATVSFMTVSAGAYDTFLMYADDSWLWGNWSMAEFPAGSVDITEDGTYTVYIDNTISTAITADEETGEDVPMTAMGAVVFNVDIVGLGEALGLEAKPEGKPADPGNIVISDVSITISSTDGISKTLDVDESKLVCGDVEDNGNFRIEIRNEFGDTKENAGVDKSQIIFDEKIAVTFTITGLSAGTSEETAVEAAAGNTTAAAASAKGSADTGIEGIAVVLGLAMVSTGAVVVSRKRK